MKKNLPKLARTSPRGQCQAPRLHATERTQMIGSFLPSPLPEHHRSDAGSQHRGGHPRIWQWLQTKESESATLGHLRNVQDAASNPHPRCDCRRHLALLVLCHRQVVQGTRAVRILSRHGQRVTQSHTTPTTESTQRPAAPHRAAHQPPPGVGRCAAGGCRRCAAGPEMPGP